MNKAELITSMSEKSKLTKKDAELALKSNKNLNEMTLKEMDLLWEQAKNKEFNEEKKDL